MLFFSIIVEILNHFMTNRSCWSLFGIKEIKFFIPGTYGWGGSDNGGGGIHVDVGGGVLVEVDVGTHSGVGVASSGPCQGRGCHWTIGVAQEASSSSSNIVGWCDPLVHHRRQKDGFLMSSICEMMDVRETGAGEAVRDKIADSKVLLPINQE